MPLKRGIYWILLKLFVVTSTLSSLIVGGILEGVIPGKSSETLAKEIDYRTSSPIISKNWEWKLRLEEQQVKQKQVK